MLQTTELKCPQCGNPNNVVGRDVAYGYEIQCRFCNTVSVITVNHELYIPDRFERICVKCGRVNDPNAVVCTCGAGLTRKCVNPDCRRLFAIHRLTCEHCNYPQHLDPLSAVGKQAMAELAIRNLASPDAYERRIAAENLERMGVQAAFAAPFLIPIVERDPIQASRVITAIGGAAASTVPALIQRIRYLEYDTSVASAVCKALGSIGAPAKDALPVLVSLLQQATERENNVYTSVVADVFNAIEQISEAIQGDIPPEVTPLLIGVLDHSPYDAEIRDACDALARLGSPVSQAEDALLKVFVERPAARWQAWAVLKVIDCARPDYLVEMMLRWRDEIPRACEELAEMGDAASETAPVLIEILRSPTQPEAARAAAQMTLVSIGKKAVPALIELLGDPNVPGNYAVFTLVQIGEPSVPALIDTLNDNDEYTRKAACVALGKLGLKAKDALPALKSLTGMFSLAPGAVKDVARITISAIEMGSPS